MADTSKTERNLEELVAKLTGFENGSENFRRTMQYVLSNTKYHRYLDVDSHRITRELKGVREKLEVHSKADKADALKKTVERFLEGPLLSPKTSHPKTDSHYSILSVLMQLSGTPTAEDYEEKDKETEKDREPEFDWGKYLLEDLDPLKNFDEPSSDEWEDEEEIDIPEEPMNDSGMIADHTHQASTYDASQLSASSRVTGTMVTGGGEGDRSWLANNVMVQYWRGDMNRTMDGIHRCSQVAGQWEAHEKAQSVFPIVDDWHEVTETQIIRETIWILMGAEKSFVYHRHGNCFDVRENIRVTHLTPTSLTTVLNHLASVGSCVLQLQTFIDEMRRCPSSYCNADVATNTAGLRCQTFEAYAEALAEFLHAFRNHLVHLEKTVLIQEEQVTLANLIDNLAPWVPPLQLLASIHSKAVVNFTQPKCVYRVCHLLKTLQESISEHFSMGEFSEEMVKLLAKMWMKTLRPYVDFLDRWLALGHLYDPAQEFVIQRNSSVEVQSPAFWQEGFMLHRHQPSGRGDAHRGDIAVPPFLQPVLRHVILAGKCMEILGSVGQLGTIRTEQTLESTSMYNQLIKASEILQDLRSPSAVTIATDEAQQLVVHQLRLPGTTDPLLAKNFDDIREKIMLSEDSTDNEGHTATKANLPPGVDSIPLSLVIKRCLYPSIISRCNVICLQLVNTLKAKFALMENLSILRKFYLLEDGDVMGDFYLDIFDKLRKQESWSEYMYLNGHLQEALRPRYPEEVERLTVSVATSEISAKLAARPIHALDGLTLHYQVNHPLDIIIHSQSLDTYNRVFRFLLQVKRAKNSLDQVLADLKKETHDDEDEPKTSQPELSSQSEAIIKHHLYLLRFKLMHFVNNIHNYLMTRILHTTSLEFQQDVDSATNLDEILTAHQSYLTKVLQRCLLHDKVGLVREAVVKVLNMALVFQRKWDAGIHTFSTDSIAKMEGEFHNCSVFLSTMLNNMTKRGAFPHLAALSFSLSSLHQSSSGVVS